MPECGECTVCCKIVEVSEGTFHKEAGEMCIHCNNGCTIFGEKKRPSICRSYQCAWLRGFGNKEDRPDKSGVMLSISKFNGGTWIFVQETKVNASTTIGKNIIIDTLNKVKLPVIISDYYTETGKDYGNRVIIHNKMNGRAKSMLGKKLEELSENITVYKLNR